MAPSARTLVALACVLLVGCEDGPTQTEGPAAPGAAGNWNSAGADASYGGVATQGYDAGGGGTNAVDVCTAPEQALAWTGPQGAFTKAVVPPFSMGGIDLSAGGTFGPVTLEDVIHGTNGQPKLCQGASAGLCYDHSGFPAYAWGPNQQLYTCYDPASHAITYFTNNPGYSGPTSFKLPKTYGGAPVPRAVDPQSGAPAELDFVLPGITGAPITVNGQVLKGKNGGPLWSSSGMDPWVANQLYLALLYTFQPTLIAVTAPGKSPPLNELTDPNSDCVSTQKCRNSANPDASGGNFGVRSVGFYIDVSSSQSANAATAATPSDEYIYPVRFVPYSLSAYNEGLDTFVSPNSDPALQVGGAPIYGPYAPAGVLSPLGAPQTPFCTLYMGETWGHFAKACVDVTGNPAIDKLSMAKLLGSQHHSSEWFTFSVVGANQNFSADAAELTQNGQPGVLQDDVTTPADDDVATDFIVDVRASGPKLNDMRGDSYPASAAVTALDAYEDSRLAGQDMHGTAAVYGYYRALVMDALRALEPPGWAQPEPAACWFDSRPYPTQAALANALQAWVAPSGCTGFEQMLTMATPPPTAGASWTDVLDLGPQGYASVATPTSIFQPGDPSLHFYADPVRQVGADNNSSIPNLLQASLAQVTSIMGHGNVASLPANARDWRFYLQLWAQAYVGYLLNRSLNPTWQQLYADHVASAHTLRQLNPDALFFDISDTVDRFEYIDRSHAGQLGAPLDFAYSIKLGSSNAQEHDFYQRLSRAESAMYQVMLTADASGSKSALVPGSNENVYVSDLFGAPAIFNAVSAAPAVDAAGKPVPGKDAWYCVTHVDSQCPVGPPTDAAGNVLLDGQGRPLFTNYRGIWTGTPFTIGNKLEIASELPFVKSAVVRLPSYSDPYDPSTSNVPITTIVPWIPSQPGNGFSIPINGQRAQFVQTGSFDFTGVTITANVDYLPVSSPDGGAPTRGTIAAVETQDFLGEVFPCVDAPTGDILRVKMYTSTADITDWLARHPTAQAACNIYIRYSPYNNYPDYITSVTNGVTLGIGPGAAAGPSRIADVTLFDPSLLTQTQ